MSSSPTDHKTISIDVYEDGKLKSLAGAMGNITIEAETGKRVMLKCSFSGRWIAPTDAAIPSWSPSTAAPMRAQSANFTIDSLSARISRASLDMGNSVAPRWNPSESGGIEHYMITDYAPKLSIDPEAELVANYDWFGKKAAGTTAAISQIFSDSAVDVTVTIPAAQIAEIETADRDGVIVENVMYNLLHNSGNDAVSITFSASS